MINGVYFYKDWQTDFEIAWTIQGWEIEGLSKFDPWEISRIDNFTSLASQKQKFEACLTEVTLDEQTGFILQPNLAQNSLSVLKSLAIAIASDSVRMLQFYQYGWQSRHIITSVV